MNDEPWKDEPDRVEWKHDNGLDCLMVRGPHGAWCGYAGVTADHPMYGKPYQDYDLDVHGGLTYSDYCHGKICHKTDDHDSPTYWFGFDCAHGFDFIPAFDKNSMRATLNDIITLGEAMLGIKPHTDGPLNTYRDIDYVKNQVNKLASQLGAVS